MHACACVRACVCAWRTGIEVIVQDPPCAAEARRRPAEAHEASASVSCSWRTLRDCRHGVCAWLSAVAHNSTACAIVPDIGRAIMPDIGHAACDGFCDVFSTTFGCGRGPRTKSTCSTSSLRWRGRRCQGLRGIHLRCRTQAASSQWRRPVLATHKTRKTPCLQ